MKSENSEAPRAGLPFYISAAGLFLLIAALFVLRRPDALLNPQFWAEDGRVLFQSQLLDGFITSVLSPHRGYLIVNSRILAALAAIFPTVYAPLIYNLAAIGIAALACSLLALPSYRHLVRSDALRVAVCIAAACALCTESLVNNLSNSQWYLALAGFLVLFKGPSPGRYARLQTGLCALLAMLAALTNPAMIIAVPACIWQILRKRNRTTAAAMMGGLAIQVLSYLHSGSAEFLNTDYADKSPSLSGLNLKQLVTSVVIATVYKVIIPSFGGWQAVTFIRRSSAVVGVFYAVAVVSAGWLIWLWFRLEGPRRHQMLGLLYLGSASIALPMATRTLSAAFLDVRTPGERGEQYFILASCVLLMLLAFTIERFLGDLRGEIQAGLFLVLLSGGFISNFRVPPFADFNWPVQAAHIENWRSGLRTGVVVGLSVPINPVSWAIQLPGNFRDLRITGFPEHVVGAAMNGGGIAFEVPPGHVRSLPSLKYVGLPPVFSPHEEYRIRVEVDAADPATVSLFVHGVIGRGAQSETAPSTVRNGDVVETRIVPDSTAKLCVHLRRHSGGFAFFRTIAIARVPREPLPSVKAVTRSYLR